MTFGEKLSKIRKENNYTQEQLAEALGVSRQSVSKWEADIAFSETEKIIRISEIFECSLDWLLKDRDTEEAVRVEIPVIRGARIKERKSQKTLFGLPLWCVGKNAKGFIAVGFRAKGVIAIGLLSTGLISIGLLSIGLFSLGMIAIGLMALGCFALGAVAAGSISIGIMAFGAVAVGKFAVGAAAVGSYAALGDSARAMIALGDSEAVGTIFEKAGELTEIEIMRVRQTLDQITPSYLGWAKWIFKLFL